MEAQSRPECPAIIEARCLRSSRAGRGPAHGRRRPRADIQKTGCTLAVVTNFEIRRDVCDHGLSGSGKPPLRLSTG